MYNYRPQGITLCGFVFARNFSLSATHICGWSVSLSSLRDTYTRSRGRTPCRSRAAPSSTSADGETPHACKISRSVAKSRCVYSTSKALKGVWGKNKSFAPTACCKVPAVMAKPSPAVYCKVPAVMAKPSPTVCCKSPPPEKGVLYKLHSKSPAIALLRYPFALLYHLPTPSWHYRYNSCEYVYNKYSAIPLEIMKKLC